MVTDTTTDEHSQATKDGLGSGRQRTVTRNRELHKTSTRTSRFHFDRSSAAEKTSRVQHEKHREMTLQPRQKKTINSLAEGTPHLHTKLSAPLYYVRTASSTSGIQKATAIVMTLPCGAELPYLELLHAKNPVDLHDGFHAHYSSLFQRWRRYCRFDASASGSQGSSRGAFCTIATVR